MATAPAKKAAPTVTLKHLAANLADSHEMSKKQTEAVLGDLVGLVTKHLKKGDRIRIGGLGILQVRKRAARMGRNPATGEPIQIKARRRLPSGRQGTQGSGLNRKLLADLSILASAALQGRWREVVYGWTTAQRMVGDDGLEPPTSSRVKEALYQLS